MTRSTLDPNTMSLMHMFNIRDIFDNSYGSHVNIVYPLLNSLKCDFMSTACWHSAN